MLSPAEPMARITSLAVGFRRRMSATSSSHVKA
jgi:hypothetical protein